MICSRCQSMSGHVSAEASACPSPASPINSTKSALSSASCPLNCWERMLSTIAANCSNVGVLRIGLSSLTALRFAAGECDMIPSPTAIARISLIQARWRLRDTGPNLYRANHNWISEGLILLTCDDDPVGHCVLMRFTMKVLRSTVFGFWCWIVSKYWSQSFASVILLFERSIWRCSSLSAARLRLASALSVVSRLRRISLPSVLMRA